MPRSYYHAEGYDSLMPRDLLLRCAECGTGFIWTVSEQGAGPQPALCAACRLLTPPAGRQRGIVKWFSHSKGYGFITPAVSGADLFFHKSGLASGQALPRAGQLVEFTIVTTQRGMQAADVVVLEVPATSSINAS
jgi:CspA family cold shock protein